MGTDIWVHVEYRDRRKKRYKHTSVDIGPYRPYLLFDILGGGRGNRNPLYYPRGLPGDVTNETYTEYKDGGPELFHHASWLETQEYRECLDTYYEIVGESDEGSAFEDMKKNLELIYRYMKDSDDEGEPARLVFWFDN